MLAGRRSFPLNRDFGQSGDELVRAERAIFPGFLCFSAPNHPNFSRFLAPPGGGTHRFLAPAAAKW